MNNLDLWNDVCRTDPSMTKRVNQRGGFTTIDAYSQIMAATKKFGPVGEGWGWSIEQVVIEDPMLILHVQFWWKLEPNYVPHATYDVMGSALLRTGDRHDQDAPLKALTHAITKALSYLGFNADVFLGQFDDNKYVEQRKQEVAAEKASSQVQAILDEIASAQLLADLAVVKSRHSGTVRMLPKETMSQVIEAMAARKTYLESIVEAQDHHA